MSKQGRGHRRPAFTLIELLVVVAIIALLMSILLPAFSAARKQARTVVCRSNMRQVASGWLLYAADNKDTLPGSTNDYIDRQTGMQPPNHPGYPVDYDRYESMCWLGTIGETGDQLDDVPSKGTIFKYVGQNEDVYKCPEDRIDVIEGGAFGQWANETKYSYTAWAGLTGATLSMFRRTYFAESFNPAVSWYYWMTYARESMPWMLIEEDENEALAFVVDSAWGNNDTISKRHRGAGMIAYMDGHVDGRKYQKQPAPLSAWRVYYKLSDGRIITCGYWYDTLGKPIRLGYLRGRYVNGVINLPW